MFKSRNERKLLDAGGQAELRLLPRRSRDPSRLGPRSNSDDELTVFIENKLQACMGDA